MTIDILPTVANLVGAKLPAHPIDGKDIWPLIAGKEGATSPHDAYFFYYGSRLEAMRMGKWKLHFPHRYRTMNGRPGGTDGIPTLYSQAEIGLSLFDLENDIGESTDVKAEHPEIVATMQELAAKARAELGDGAMKLKGSGVRKAGRLKE